MIYIYIGRILIIFPQKQQHPSITPGQKMQAKPPRSSNNPSTFTDSKRKNTTFMSSASKSILRFDNVQQTLQMIKISLKKQTDRRNKLRKLLQKYNQIYTQQKKHVKQIKSSIIEMKDSNAASKLKLLIDPTIFVQNKIKISTRQFLCTLMNTFYRTYQQNDKNNQIIVNLNNVMTFMIKGISYNQDMIFLMQKNQINQQIQLQGDLLTQKNRLKEQIVKIKYTKQEHGITNTAYLEAQQKNTTKKQIIQQLRHKLQQLTQQSESLNKNIQEQLQMRSKCQDKIDTELLYHAKFKSQINQLDKQVQLNKKQSRKMLKKLFSYQIKEEQIKTCRKGIGQQIKNKIKFELTCQFDHLRS